MSLSSVDSCVRVSFHPSRRTCGQDRRLRNPYEVAQDPCFDLVAREYKFYLSFENDICNDYVTEKAYNALKFVKSF